MDEYARRQEILHRIAQILAQMPDDVLLQLIQHWEAELREVLANEPKVLIHEESEYSLSDQT